MPDQVIKTTKREPLYEDADGLLYEQLTHAEGMRDLGAIREIVPARPGSEQETTVRWLRPLGTVSGSHAEHEAFAKHAAKLESKTVQEAAGTQQGGGETAAAKEPAGDQKTPAEPKAAKKEPADKAAAKK